MIHPIVQRIHCLLIDLKTDFEHCEKVVEFLVYTNRPTNLEHHELARKLYKTYKTRRETIDDVTSSQTLCYTHEECHQHDDETMKLYNEVAEVCDRVMRIINSRDSNGL